MKKKSRGWWYLSQDGRDGSVVPLLSEEEDDEDDDDEEDEGPDDEDDDAGEAGALTPSPSRRTSSSCSLSNPSNTSVSDPAIKYPSSPF